LSTAASPSQKILSWDAARQWRFARRSERIVFTNGVFDLLHPGHVDVLLAARREGDSLVVGLNSDESVRRLKGPTRPVRDQTARAYVVGALEMVDVVVLFEQDTPLELIRRLEPDVLVKGGDYAEETIIGAADVRARGGRVVVVPLTPGQSTTSIVQSVRGKP
jgi:D-beta-D-heptose 7-phosphate kinase/D-beta-D-heptose 1-phosphate adenosyltransferase